MFVFCPYVIVNIDKLPLYIHCDILFFVHFVLIIFQYVVKTEFKKVVHCNKNRNYDENYNVFFILMIFFCILVWAIEVSSRFQHFRFSFYRQ